MRSQTDFQPCAMTQDTDRWSFSAAFFNTWSCSKHCFAIHQITSTRSQPSRSPVCLCYSVELWSSLADTPVFKSQSKFNQLTTMAPSCSSSLSFCKDVLLSPPLDWHCTEEYLVLSMKRWLCAFLFKKKQIMKLIPGWAGLPSGSVHQYWGRPGESLQPH